MRPVVTVLYEDRRVGKEYALHKLVLRMVEDDVNGETWRLRKVVADNPRGGIDSVLADVRAASLIAKGGWLFVLVDRDRIVAHVNQQAAAGGRTLQAQAADQDIVDVVVGMSDNHERVRVFLLHENLEGLIAAIEQCGSGQLAKEIAAAKRKNHTAREFVLNHVAAADRVAVRQCVRKLQSGLDAMVHALAEVIPHELRDIAPTSTG